MITLISKILVFFMEISQYRPIYAFGKWVLSPVAAYPNFELLIVMAIIPVILNSG